jgi:hypothetical protein
MIRPTMSHVLNKQDLYSLMGDYATYLERKIAGLEGDVSFYRCCALSGEIPDDLSSPSSVALQAKTLKEQGSMRGTLADPNYNYDKKEYRKGEVEDE